MTDSSLHPQENSNSTPPQRKRVCDYCNDSTAILYCRADSAKLCFSCDREVHSANQLFSKHSRSLLCDACDDSPASVFCETEHSIFCQNCDWERHNLSLSSIHNRRPIEGFSGCPSVGELVSIVGFEDLGHKALFLHEENDGRDDALAGLGDGLSELLFWESPAIVSIDDLIVSSGSAHSYQAMGVPVLPKNRNPTCGQHKEEILCQLRELAKLEPDVNYESVDIQTVVPPENLQCGNTCNHCELDAEADTNQWFGDCGEANQVFIPSTLSRNYFNESYTVPEKHSDFGGGVSHANDGHEEQPQHPTATETLSVFPKVSPHELNSQERDSAISRYKEKKKTRRYDKHIRYESRKVRAESRTRIRGRFAKMDH